MKKLIALLLVLCVCTALFVACQTPDTPDDPTPPSGDQGGNTPGGDQGGNTPGGDQGGNTPGGDQGGNTPGGDQGGNTPGGDEGGNTPGGNEGGNTPGGNEGGNTPGGETPEKLGEQITAEQWAAMTAGGSNPFTNYTGAMKETDSDGAVTSVTVMLNGAEYIVTMQQGTMTMKFAAFLMNSELCYFTYNAETGKWVEQESESMMASMAKSYILAGCPYPFTQLVYNEETGVYTCSYLEDTEDTEPEQVEAIFKNGALVQMKVVEGSTLIEITGSDYGTTVVPRPTAEEIQEPAAVEKGEQITAEQWAALLANLPTNYTYTQTMDTGILGAFSEIVKRDGNAYYMETSGFGVNSIYWGQLVNGVPTGYEYDDETGKWIYDAYSDISYPGDHPLTALPADFSEYTYDAQTGTYSVTISDEDDYSVTYILTFRDGTCVSLCEDLGGGMLWETVFSDLGTTVIKAPAEEDLMIPEDDDATGDEFQFGYEITEEQFNALKTNSPTNYSYVETRYYNGQLVVIERMIDGECFMDIQYDADGNLTRCWCCVRVGDSYVDYGYDIATGKWQEHNSSISTNYPLSGFPLALSNFVYDAEWGIYVYEMSETVRMEIAFDSEGNLCYIGQYDGENYSETYFSDYGTTVIEAPAAEDIIPGNSGVGNTDPGHGSDVIH